MWMVERRRLRCFRLVGCGGIVMMKVIAVMIMIIGIGIVIGMVILLLMVRGIRDKASTGTIIKSTISKINLW